MVKVILRQEAIDDLNEIWNYTFEEWSERQADKYYDTIKYACEEIGRNPNYNQKKIERHLKYIDEKLAEYNEALSCADGDADQSVIALNALY